MNRLSIIQQIIDAKKAKNYLEIGVSTGWLFFKVKASQKIAVDPHFIFPWYNKVRRYLKLYSTRYYEMTSDNFFEKNANAIKDIGGIDVAFIDGLHTYEQAYTDVLNCLKYLNPGGIILIHDCNPPNEACAWPAKNIVEYRKLASTGYIPGYLNSWNGDVWKTIVRLRSEHDDLVVGTIDLDWGIGFVYRGHSKEKLMFTEDEIEAMTYNDLAQNRTLLLGLQAPLTLANIIESI